ncbi:MAG TPA: hypothetical protein VF263_26150 [Longimicrobiaceae bacterium]
MRKRSTPIGEILVGLGRISPEDVERALAYQRDRGGYFGDALVALEMATPAEVKWGLADQYDLPFVNLRPDSIDRSVAARVPPGWAREHLVLPVLRDGDTVTVVLADPRDLGRLIEVQQYTGAANVEAALSTPAIIRALIDAVHGEPDAAPVPLLRFLVEALESGAEAVGVSVRSGRAEAWSRRGAVTHRVLDADPLPELRQMVTPFPDPPGGSGGVRRWPARVAVPGAGWTVECHLVGDAASLEWAARVTGGEAAHAPAARVEPEAREALAGALLHGPVLVEARPGGVGVGDEELERAMHGLPELLLERAPRCVHLSDRASAGPGGEIVIPAGESPVSAAESLRPFGLDALTVDVRDAAPGDVEALRGAAPLVVAHLRSGRAVEGADAVLTLRTEGVALLWTRGG